MEVARDEGPVAKRRLILVGVMIGMSTAIDIVASLLKAGANGWMFSGGVTAAITLVLAAYLWRTRDALIARIALLGIIVGFGELPTDAWAVSGVKILTYNPGGPFIWDSPLYMPFAWAVTLVELGYFGYWLAGRWGLVRASLAVAVIGGLFLPGTETMAYHAGFWSYHGVWSIGITPVFLIPPEALITATFPLLALLASRLKLPLLVPLGLLTAAFMYAMSVLFYALMGNSPA